MPILFSGDRELEWDVRGYLRERRDVTDLVSGRSGDRDMSADISGCCWCRRSWLVVDLCVLVDVHASFLVVVKFLVIAASILAAESDRRLGHDDGSVSGAPVSVNSSKGACGGSSGSGLLGDRLLHRLLLQLGSGSCPQARVALQFDVACLHALHQRSGLGDKLLFEELWYGVVDELWPGIALLVYALRVGVPDVGLEVGRL